MKRPIRFILMTFLATLLSLPSGPRAAAKPPEAAAVRDVIRARIESIGRGGTVRIGGDEITAWKPLPALYQIGDFGAKWTNPAAIDDLLEEVRYSAEEGLEPGDFHPAAIERLRKESPDDAAARADLDLLLTDSLARLTYQTRFGKVDPLRLDRDWNLTTSLHGVDPVTWMQQTIEGGRIRESIGKFEPTHPFYGKVKRALADYRRIEKAGGWPAVPEGPTIKPGMTDPRIPVLRRRLAITGDLPEAPADGESADYD